MVETSLYPFKPGRSGIHTRELRETAGDQIISGSGRKLNYCLTPTKVSFSDANDPDVHLMATLENKALHFDIQERLRRSTVDRFLPWHPAKHPDLYGRDFVHFAIIYFIKHGSLPNDYTGYWGVCKNAETYQQFLDNYLQHSNPVLAAQEVSVAKAIAQHGFINIQESDIEYGCDYYGSYIQATFHRLPKQ